MSQRLNRFLLSIFILSSAIFLWSGCSGLPGGSGGGVSSKPRFIEGTFTSSPKTGKASADYKIATMIFTKSGQFKAYRDAETLKKQEPDIEGSYEIVDNDIIFKNPSGTEYQNRGTLLDSTDTKFEWPERFPGDVFGKN